MYGALAQAPLIVTSDTSTAITGTQQQQAVQLRTTDQVGARQSMTRLPALQLLRVRTPYHIEGKGAGVPGWSMNPSEPLEMTSEDFDALEDHIAADVAAMEEEEIALNSAAPGGGLVMTAQHGEQVAAAVNAPTSAVVRPRWRGKVPRPEHGAAYTEYLASLETNEPPAEYAAVSVCEPSDDEEKAAAARVAEQALLKKMLILVRGPPKSDWSPAEVFSYFVELTGVTTLCISVEDTIATWSAGTIMWRQSYCAEDVMDLEDDWNVADMNALDTLNRALHDREDTLLPGSQCDTDVVRHMFDKALAIVRTCYHREFAVRY